MFFSSALQVVFKTTGGRVWNKPWGLPRLSATRKANRRKNLALFNKNISVLKAAAAAEPAEPFRLDAPLPQWQRQQMAAHLRRAQQLINWRGSMLPAAAAAAAGEPMGRRR
ncbi:MAG: hypothetical protein J3K34DRAFT_475954 [Monoraphidium minutum]|nr:MAG: hypothetical protein J3K34DRAFT_475954 [Monoraphidium minutum]